jgi:hypothetical protein
MRRTEGCTPGPILDIGDGDDRARLVIVSMLWPPGNPQPRSLALSREK